MQDSLIVVDAAGTVTTLNDATCALLGWHARRRSRPADRRFVDTAPTTGDRRADRLRSRA